MGMNLQAMFSNMEKEECIYAYNIVAQDRGMRVRPGSEEWNNSITGSGKTIIPFHSQDGSDKLFVCGDDGIYEMSSQGDGTGTLVYSFLLTGVDAGEGVFVQYTNDAGDSFILYADKVNGLLEYDVAGDSWGVPSGITGITLTSVRYVWIHKQRVWLALDSSDVGYYLPIGQKSGAATAFYFGGLFPHGGEIVGYWTWTRDGGEGIDDYFIIVGRGGDLLAYQGADPSAASTWTLKGNWYLGHMPAGRRIAVDYGGELFVLSSFGLLTLSALFRGVDVSDFRVNPTAKITPQIRERMQAELDSARWEVYSYPQEGLIVINSPVRPGNSDEYLQYVFSVTTQAWSMWRDLNMVTCANWNGQFFFTDNTGIIWTLSEGQDNRLIADTDASEAVPIDFSVLGSFQRHGLTGNMIGEFLRPVFTGIARVTYNARFVYDYEVDEITGASLDSLTEGDLWDTGLWDTAVWSSSTAVRSEIEGGGGIGRTAAIAIRGQGYFRANLLEIDVAARRGGFL